MARNAWITPAVMPDGLRCRALYIPADDRYWEACLIGALLLLSEEENWEQVTGITAQQAALVWESVLDEYLKRGECMAIGTVMAFAGVSVPDYYLACDGTEYFISEYPSLFEVIADSFGGDGVTRFCVPDLRGRAALGVGQGAGLTNRALAQSGGEESHVLTVNEMPTHSHSVHAHLPLAAGELPAPVDAPALLSGNTGSAGGDAAHNNMSPWLALRMIIYAGENRQTDYFTKVWDISPSNLVAYWRMDDLALSGIIRDWTSNNYHATPVNVGQGSDGMGDNGLSAYFDGTAYATLPAGFLPVQSYRDEGTIMFWLNMPAYPATQYPFHFRNASSSPDRYDTSLSIASAGNTWTVSRRGGADSSARTAIMTDMAAPTGWHCFAMHWSVTGGFLRAYFDGELRGTCANTITPAGTPDLDSPQSPIGAYTTSPFFPMVGNMAHFALWNTPLSADDIAALAVIA
jgi:microcystin-dependent protein